MKQSVESLHRAQGGSLKCPACQQAIEDDWELHRAVQPEQTACPHCDAKFFYVQLECRACEEENSLTSMDKETVERAMAECRCLACNGSLVDETDQADAGETA